MKAKMRKNDVVRSLLDGEFYKIMSVGDEAVMLQQLSCEEKDGKRTFKEIDEVISIAKGIFDELFYIVEAAQAPVPEDEFEISGGKLLRNGQKIETGTLVPDEIKTLIPGAVIMTVKSRTEGKLDLFHYDVETDKFTKMSDAKGEIELVYLNDSAGITGFLMKNSEKVLLPAKDKSDDPLEAESVWESVRFYDGARGIYASENELEMPVIGEKTCFTIARNDDGEEKHILLFKASAGAKRVTTTDGKQAWVCPKQLPKERTLIRRFVLEYSPEVFVPYITADEVEFNGTNKNLLECRDEDGNFVFVTEEGIVHSNWGHGKRYAIGQDVLDVVAEYPRPISLNFEGRTITTFTFAKESYAGVAKIRVEKTRDRGFVTTIEEIK